MDIYYKLKFFAVKKDSEDVENAFDYPLHFESPEDALVWAEYWMVQGLFGWCRCDQCTDPVLVPTEFKAGEFKAGIFFMQNDGTMDSIITERITFLSGNKPKELLKC